MVDAGVRRRRRQAAMALAEAVDSAKMPTGILSHTIEVFDPHQYLYTLRLLRDSMTQSNQRLSCSESCSDYRAITNDLVLLFRSHFALLRPTVQTVAARRRSRARDVHVIHYAQATASIGRRAGIPEIVHVHIDRTFQS
jgi:hypothetical protein